MRMPWFTEQFPTRQELHWGTLARNVKEEKPFQWGFDLVQLFPYIVGGAVLGGSLSVAVGLPRLPYQNKAVAKQQTQAPVTTELSSGTRKSVR